jgi:hypothetical protein
MSTRYQCVIEYRKGKWICKGRGVTAIAGTEYEAWQRWFKVVDSLPQKKRIRVKRDRISAI